MPRALLSVSDKSGLIPFAQGLSEQGFELVASGGTARALREAGLEVTDVASVTGSPEILGGRVKTLHPAIHGGILARPTESDLAELARHGIAPFELVVCNLYPFRQTVAQPDVTEADAIEQIDIGGVALLRAAAKSFERVAVVVDPARYGEILTAIQGDGISRDTRRALAVQAFQHTAAYDAAIQAWLASGQGDADALPEVLHLVATREETLRYGENSHQQAAVYRLDGERPAFEQVGGLKALSYNNLADLEAAWAMASEFDRPAVAIIKHMNPSGLAVADDLRTAYERAFACDTVSAFGGILAANREVDADFVEGLGKLFLEILAAPSFTDDALALMAARKKNCRVLRWTGQGTSPHLQLSAIHGGLLVQTVDPRGVSHDGWTVVSERAPTAQEARDLAFAEVAAKHVKSNAIVLCRHEATVGVGAGQMNRVDSVRIAAWRAGERAQGSVLASDAFFPFADGVEAAAEAGATAILQPGGSIRDEEVIAAANRLGLAMVVTGVRHFRH